jgi:methylmalonyl-CoA/ethylmalonyl-CoA epimerase
MQGIDHVVIRVHDLDAAIASYEKLGMTLSRRLETPAIGKQAIFDFPDGSFVELVAPLSPDSPIGKALESRGEGVHTVSFAVGNAGETAGAMKANGATVIEIDGLDGIAFVHPKSAHGVMLQVTESKS